MYKSNSRVDKRIRGWIGIEGGYGGEGNRMIGIRIRDEDVWID